MADNVRGGADQADPLRPTIATDDVGGIHYQRVKLDVGADGASTPVVGTVPVSGTVAGTQSGTWTVQPGNTANTTAWKVDGSAVTQPVSGTVTANAGTNLNTSTLATSANQTTELTDLGGVTETAPASDTASSGLNGRLQRIAQRLTSIIALLPTSLGGSGGLKVEGPFGAVPVTSGGVGTDARTTPSDFKTDAASQAVATVAGHVFNGATWDRFRQANVFKTLSAVVITSETTIWTPTSGKKFRLMGYAITQGVVTGAITLKDNTAGTTILIIPPNTIGVYQISPDMGQGILSGAINRVLTATGASTETITGYVFGTEE